MTAPLITTTQLNQVLNDPNVLVLNARMNKVVGKDPILYDTPLFIPGSVSVALETELCDLDAEQTHAMPTEAQFTEWCQRLGITEQTHIVVYDDQGIYSAPRLWWTCKRMGLERVSVLDGGLPQWLDDELPTSSNARHIEASSNTVAPNLNPAQQRVCDADHVLANIDNAQVAIVDARANGRFLGQSPEPRAGVRSGHIPSAVNLPFLEVLSGHKMKSKPELKALFATLLQGKQTMIASCGSGITACILLLAAEVTGVPELILYDGSWAEWGSNPALPIE